MYPTWKSLVKNSSLPNSSVKSNGYKHGLRGHLVEVYREMHKKHTPTGTSTTNKDMTVTGKFIQHSSRPSQKVIFWIYGGAYLAGDSDGNLGIAEKMGLLCGQDEGEVRDVFIPNYRLVPENNLDDAVRDVTLAYEWLIHERGIQPENVVLLGISSGGGLAVLLMQALAESRRNNANNCNRMPAGAVLVGPFVDYTTPKGSFSEYTKHDLIVNEVSRLLYQLV
jgi:acetyl esterase/lipase